MKNVKNLSTLSNPSNNLSQLAMISSIWLFLLRFIQQLFNLARIVILARLLAPEDFGLMGIALLLLATLETFSETGFQQALIQKKSDIKSYLDSAWTFLILRGLFLFIILYFLAPYAAYFFNTPEAKPIIQVIGISMVFKAFTNIGVIYFQKELEFKKQFIYLFSGALTEFVVAVIAVLLLKNVWALVFGMLAGKAILSITSYLVHPYRPHLNFDIVKIKELSNYGKWVFGSTILVFLVTQGDDILVGKMLGANALGFYQMAYLISNLPTTEITHLISQVTFPLYSKMQENIPKLSSSYFKIFQLTTFISILVTALIYVLAGDSTMIFLGEKWMPMVPVLKLLVLAGLVRSVQSTSGPVFYALGKTEIDTKIQSVRFIVIAILIYPFIVKWGLIGASLAVLVSILVTCLLSMAMIIKTLCISSRDIIYSITYPLISGVTSIFSIFYLKSIVEIGIFELIVVSLIGIIVYISVAVIIENIFDYKIISILKENIFIFN